MILLWSFCFDDGGWRVHGPTRYPRDFDFYWFGALHVKVTRRLSSWKKHKPLWFRKTMSSNEVVKSTQILSPRISTRESNTVWTHELKMLRTSTFKPKKKVTKIVFTNGRTFVWSTHKGKNKRRYPVISFRIVPSTSPNKIVSIFDIKFDKTGLRGYSKLWKTYWQMVNDSV